jgi:ribosome-associated protein
LDKIQLIIHVLNERKAENIKLIDLRNTGNIGEYAIVADVGNARLLKALADYLIEALEKAGYDIHHVEGKHQSEWTLIDAHDVIVHLFLTPARNFYRLDELYLDKQIQL